MKNIFCLLFIFLLSLPANAQDRENAVDAALKTAKAEVSRQTEGKEVLVDGNALRAGAKNEKKEQGQAEENPFRDAMRDKEKLAGMLNDDREILEALEASSIAKPKPAAPSRAPVKTARKTQRNTDPDNLTHYSEPYGLSDARYFPSRRRNGS